MDHDFLSDDFLLDTPLMRTLYHEHAAQMPIYDYHCHLSAAEIAEDRRFDNLTQAWLAGDHYKWRAMRTNGVDERYCTGDAGDEEKFQAWARTVPATVGNPLYVWTHLELQRYFHLAVRLNAETAATVYARCNERLARDDYRCRGLLRRMNVALVCTTEDPLDDLRHHEQIAADPFGVTVTMAWRPDRAWQVADPAAWNKWVERLAGRADMDIVDFPTYIIALRRRHEYFHAHGCRISDHGVATVWDEPYSGAEINIIFDQLRQGKVVDAAAQRKVARAMLYEFALMDHEQGWVQQYHLGALRRVNTRMTRRLGPDTGFDSIGDLPLARGLGRLLDQLDQDERLTRTIVYNLNPRDNELLATMIGNFQDGLTPGKMQFGSGWWFLDQRDGMTRQLTALANLGLLSRFVGMLTDSRSFLSFPRHEYFRRVLCRYLGELVALGEAPADADLLGEMVRDICFHNARAYFGIDLPAWAAGG